MIKSLYNYFNKFLYSEGRKKTPVVTPILILGGIFLANKYKYFTFKTIFLKNQIKLDFLSKPRKSH